LELKVNVNIVSNSINRDLLEELTAAQLVRKFTPFMESEGSFSKKIWKIQNTRKQRSFSVAVSTRRPVT
jgi:hypothetical protein